MGIIIEHRCNNVEKRPPVSHILREYLSAYINNEVFLPYHLSSKNDIILSIIFAPQADTGDDAEYWLSNPTVYIKDNVKLYTIYVPFDITRYEDKLEAYIEVCLNAVIFFLEKTYKKLKSFDFNALYKNVNMDYVYSIPFPAPFNQQKFIGDDTFVKEVIIKHGTNPPLVQE